MQTGSSSDPEAQRQRGILDLIQHADVIFAIEESALVEQGTHEELLARNGVYAGMHRIQSPEGVKIVPAESAA